MRTVWTGLACLLSLAPAAGAETRGAATVAAGAVLFLPGGGTGLGHLRLGGEWAPDKGPGFAVDGGWLWAGLDPEYGVGTVSPSFVYSLGRTGRTTAGLRAGYTLLFRSRFAHAVHAGIAVDTDLGSGSRLRFEVRDTILPWWDNQHVVEVALGVVFPSRSGSGKAPRAGARPAPALR